MNECHHHDRNYYCIDCYEKPKKPLFSLSNMLRCCMQKEPQKFELKLVLPDEILHFFKRCHFDGIKILGERIMSLIKEFADAQNAFNDRMDAAVSDLVGDIKNLNDQIAALVAQAGNLSDEDKALLDGLQVRSQSIAEKLDALNAQTPPVVPVE